MKKLVAAGLFTILFMLPVVGNAQVLISILFGEQLNSGKMEFGLITGANVSTVTGMEDAKPLPTFKLGLFLDYNFTENWIGSFEANVKNTVGYSNFTPAEALFQVQDSVIEGANRTTRSLNALQCPIYINYRFANRFSIGAGGYLSWQHGTRDLIDYTFQNTDLTIEQSFSGFIHRIDAGVVGALGYHFKKRESGYPGISLRIKASYGLRDVFNDQTTLSGNNLWFSFDVAIPIIISVF
jgi:hypothetical protein